MLRNADAAIDKRRALLVRSYSLENHRVIVALRVEEDNGATWHDLLRYSAITSHLKTLQRTQAIESAFSNPTMLDLLWQRLFVLALAFVLAIC